MSKAWAYAQITEETETMISLNMAAAKNSNGNTKKLLHEEWAYGAFMLWDRITHGFQKDGDDERLRAMTETEEMRL